MSKFAWSLVREDGAAVVTVLLDGEVYVADHTHPNFDEILDCCLDDDAPTPELFDVASSLETTLAPLSERVAVANGRVYFDDDEIDNSLTQQILRFMDEGADYAPLVKFMENLAQNPNSYSREQLYTWLADRKFTITEDGCFIAYKGVEPYGEAWRSISSGTAFVNGVEQRGQIAQEIGDVVTMPRSQVAFDPGTGCSTGLHAGTWDYASTFGRGAVLTVKINPRDVVSVPTDCDAQKLRVARYTVLESVAHQYDSVLFDEDDNETWNLKYDRFVAFDSSMLDSAYWNADNNEAYVKFNGSDKIYAYYCPADTWDGFSTAASPGSYFNENIRDDDDFATIYKYTLTNNNESDPDRVYSF